MEYQENVNLLEAEDTHDNTDSIGEVTDAELDAELGADDDGGILPDADPEQPTPEVDDPEKLKAEIKARDERLKNKDREITKQRLAKEAAEVELEKYRTPAPAPVQQPQVKDPRLDPMWNHITPQAQEYVMARAKEMIQENNISRRVEQKLEDRLRAEKTQQLTQDAESQSHAFFAANPELLEDSVKNEKFIQTFFETTGIYLKNPDPSLVLRQGKNLTKLLQNAKKLAFEDEYAVELLKKSKKPVVGNGNSKVAAGPNRIPPVASRTPSSRVETKTYSSDDAAAEILRDIQLGKIK